MNCRVVPHNSASLNLDCLDKKLDSIRRVRCKADLGKKKETSYRRRVMAKKRSIMEGGTQLEVDLLRPQRTMNLIFSVRESKPMAKPVSS